jgi:hypothetical protein
MGKCVKLIRWTSHAFDNLSEREVGREEAEKTLADPEVIAPSQSGRSLFMRRYFDNVLGKEMLLIIVVEDTEVERVVVTVFKTSQISKYLKETGL